MKHALALAHAWRTVYGPPPEDVAVFDCETSGFHKTDDYVVQLAWLQLSAGREVARGTVVFDWTRELDRFGRDDLARRLADCGAKMRARGKTHDWSLERLAAEGLPPAEAFARFTSVLAARPVLVGHNAWGFDAPVLDQLGYRLTRMPLGIPPSGLIDTNALVRAAQTGAVPRAGESYAAWAARANKSGGGKVKSNLDEYCVQTLRLDARYGVDPTKAHDAAYDCVLTGHVYTDFRTLITTGREPWHDAAAPW